MAQSKSTDYKTKCSILAEVWLNYRDDEEFEKFVDYADLGLPLAYAIANDLVESNPKVSKVIEETFELFLGAMNLTDTGFVTLDEVLELGSMDL